MSGDTINLFMDYETFGEHQWAESGIFDFMRYLPGAIIESNTLRFATPSEVALNSSLSQFFIHPTPSLGQTKSVMSPPG